MKKEELQELSKYLIMNLTTDNFEKLKGDFFNSDFILVDNENMNEETDHKLKKFIKKIGIIKEDEGKKFYQLFYYLILKFNIEDEIKYIRVILLNNEISKFIDVLKNFIEENVKFSNDSKKENTTKNLLMNYKFVNKIFIEDFKIFSYKSKIISVLKNYNYVNKIFYKSLKFIKNNFNVEFEILKNDDYYNLTDSNIYNSKLKVISNFLFMLTDLKIIEGFN